MSEDLGILIAPRCKDCGRVIGNLYNRFVEYRDQEAHVQSGQLSTPAERAFERLGIYSLCCRMHLTNPTRIPTGGYYYEPTPGTNTYIIGEYGRCYGDNNVLQFLNNKFTEPSKREIINAGINPTYKRITEVPKPLLETYELRMNEKLSEFINQYMQLNETEQTAYRRALWHLFLMSMYFRGWLGEGFSYPLKSTGQHDYTQLMENLGRIYNNDIQGIDFQNVKNWIGYLYPKIKSALPEKERMIKAMDKIASGQSNDEDMLVIEQIHQAVVANQQIVHGQSNQPNIPAAVEQHRLFLEQVTYTPGVVKLYRQTPCINLRDGKYEKQTVALHTRIKYMTGLDQPLSERIIQRMDSIRDAIDYSRIVSITCYRLLYALSSVKIPNFEPRDVTSFQQGSVFVQINAPFTPYM